MINENIQHYSILNELGRGGMATVYRAHDNKFDTNVAIKVLKKEFVHNDNIRKRFLSEAKSMFKMSHPNIIKVNDLIEENDTVAFVMEYIEGETLKEYTDRKGKLKDDEIKIIFIQMLEAVGYVHKQNLIHRDIKPSNFMINKDGKVKLMDFGIAKNTDARSAEYTLTHTGMQMGTPMYMSPEQIKSSKDVGPQTDLYSLGVVLWQMVTGRKPYDTSAISSFDMQLKIVQEDLPPTNSIWDNCIKEATQKNTYLRFKSISAFEAALRGNSSEHTVIEEQKPSGSNSSDNRGNSEPLENRFEQASVKPTSEKRSYALPILIIAFMIGLISLYRYNQSENDFSSIQNSENNYASENSNYYNRDSLVELVNLYITDNRHNQAINVLNELIDYNSQDELIWFTLGVQYEKIGDFASAEHSYLKAVDVNSEYYDALFNLGAGYYNQAYNKSKECDKISLREPAKYDLCMNEARVIMAKSIPYFEKAYSLRATDRDIINGLKTAYEWGDNVEGKARMIRALESIDK